MRTLFIFILLTSSVFAGNELGNGGNSVYNPCNDKSYFYDYYEMRIMWDWKLVLPENQATEQTIALGFAERLNDYDLELANQLKGLIKTFYEESSYMYDFGYTPKISLNDYDTLVLEEGAVLGQAIVQKEMRGKRYHISYDLWFALDKVQRAVGILHEVIYRMALIQHPTLRRAEDIRILNQYIISNQVYDNLSFFDYLADIYLKESGEVRNRGRRSPGINIVPNQCKML